MTAAALVLGGLVGSAAPGAGRFGWLSLSPLFVSMLAPSVWEEVGWRGFALARLQERHGHLDIALRISVLWELWQLPLTLNPSSPMSQLPWYGRIVFSLSLTMIYTWSYRNTQRSLFFVSVFHAMSNTAAFALLQMDVFAVSYLLIVGMDSHPRRRVFAAEPR